MRFTSLLLVFFSITCFAARRKFNEDEQPARSKRRRISPVLTPDQLILQEIHDTNPPILLKEHYQNSGLRDAKNTLENMGYWEVELPNVSGFQVFII